MKFSGSSRSAAPRAERRGRRALTRIGAAAAGAAILAAGPAVSASAATTGPAGVASAASSSSHAVPDGAAWVLVNGYYPTQFACRAVGINDYMVPDAISFKCVKMNRGSYFTWALYILLHY